MRIFTSGGGLASTIHCSKYHALKHRNVVESANSIKAERTTRTLGLGQRIGTLLEDGHLKALTIF